VARAAAYDSVAAQDAQALLREHLPLVQRIAQRLAARLPASVEIDDLLQVGLIGLLRARESWDPSQGASFATYAGIRIKGAMLDEIRCHDWVPRSVQGQFRRVAEAIERADARLGRPAQDAEIAAELDLGLEDYQRLAGELACARMVPIEDNAEAAQATTAGDPLETLGAAGSRDALVGAIEQLPERERLMMSLYYADDLNLREIGEILGVSESRVSQIHGQALARLRSRLDAWRG
jgi:RNA polymerase sigma factor for flagellar operon FliA